MSYHENWAKEFSHELDPVGGLFDEIVGRVEVKRQSRVLSERFFFGIRKGERSVYELDIDLHWDLHCKKS
jgi:hypothetical protein